MLNHGEDEFIQLHMEAILKMDVQLCKLIEHVSQHLEILNIWL